MFRQLISRRNSTARPYFLYSPNSWAATMGAQSASGMNPTRRGLLLFKIRKTAGLPRVMNFLPGTRKQSWCHWRLRVVKALLLAGTRLLHTATRSISLHNLAHHGQDGTTAAGNYKPPA